MERDQLVFKLTQREDKANLEIRQDYEAKINSLTRELICLRNAEHSQQKSAEEV